MKQAEIPFLRPAVPPVGSYERELREIDERGVYSNFGPLVKQLESEIEGRLFAGEGHLATVANATLGLILAISTLKRPGAKYALMPSFTFAATPLAAMWCGLTPYFVDIRPTDWALDEGLVRGALGRMGSDVAIVVPYATLGTSIDLSSYEEIHRAGIPVVVDAAPCAGSYSAGAHFGRGFQPPCDEALRCGRRRLRV
jgi:dTDP-4-amino-4,6-dideoxygalactose transaminase